MPAVLRVALPLAVGATLYLVGAIAYSPAFPAPAPAQIVLLLSAVVLSAVLPARDRIGAVLQTLRRPSPRLKRGLALGMFVIATGYLWLNASLQDRDRTPRVHDEHSFLIQAQMMARGRLWMPPHELSGEDADFFESFHLLTRPVYASIYFPGTALTFVPAVWLGLPVWVMPILVGGACAALLLLVATELADARVGLLASVALVSNLPFRLMATSYLAQAPMILAALLMTWCWLKWRESAGKPRLGWALALGAAGGWAAIIRPIDAIAFALPLGAGFLLDLRDRPIRASLLSVVLVLVGAAPLLGLQLVLNRGTTGQWLRSPYQVYFDRYQPGGSFGFGGPEHVRRPDTTLQQKLDCYDDAFARAIAEHRPENVLPKLLRERLPLLRRVTLADLLLVTLVPAGVLRVGDRRRWWLVAAPVLFMGLYSLNVLFLGHYPIVLAAPLAVLVGLGAGYVADHWPDASRPTAQVLAPLAVLAVSLGALHELNGRREPQIIGSMRREHVELPARVRKPAVVLFHYDAGGDYPYEPVYNYDVAWPDDAPVIRAHDLGPRNTDIFRYYARHQPRRTFYRYDRTTRRLTELGPASELANGRSQ